MLFTLYGVAPYLCVLKVLSNQPTSFFYYYYFKLFLFCLLFLTLTPVPWSRQVYLVTWRVPVDYFVWFKFCNWILSESVNAPVHGSFFSILILLTDLWWEWLKHNRHISLAQFTQDYMLATKTLPYELLQNYISDSLCFGNYIFIRKPFCTFVWLYET